MGCAAQQLAGSAITPPFAAQRAVAAATHLYVWNENVPPAELDEYPTTGGRPALRISSPRGLLAGRTAIDGNGTLYIVGGPPYAPSIGEYKAGSTKPFKTIVKGVGAVIGLTSDEKNDLYVLDSGGPLVKYAAGATKPAFATYSGLCANAYGGPEELTEDRTGGVYVLSRCGKPGPQAHSNISQFAGGAKVKRTIKLAPALLPFALTVDANLRLYVAYEDQSANYRLGIAEYDPGSTKPVASFYVGPAPSSGGNAGGGAPVVDDSTGVLYQTYDACTVSGQKLTCNSSIYVFPRGAKTPSHTFQGPAGTTLGTPVLDADGNLYAQSESPNSLVFTIQRFDKGTGNRATVLSSRRILLGFAWPTVGSTRTTVAERQFGIGSP